MNGEKAGYIKMIVKTKNFQKSKREELKKSSENQLDKRMKIS